jgi:hypothetical protein
MENHHDENQNYSGAGNVEYPQTRYLITCRICGSNFDMAYECPTCRSWVEESSLDSWQLLALLGMLRDVLGHAPMVKEKPGGLTE